ncbi:MAG: amino acid adenylation domain-containing protein [Gammaproteobacteria bacterium]
MQKLALEYLLETRARVPDKTAVIDGERSITFHELWRQSVWLGKRISAMAACRNSTIVIDIDKSIDAVIAILAVQFSGNIYVPFDSASPPQRRQRMLETLGEARILTVADSGFLLDGAPLDPFAAVDDGDLDAIGRDLLEALADRKNLDPLYVIFTSGTTGVPKGVAISNAAVIDYIDWARNTYRVTDAEIIGNQAPLYFDNSVLDLYLTLACGCTLHLIPGTRFLFPDDVLGYIAEQGINFVFFVPSLFSNFAAVDAFAGHDLSCLQKVLFAGEAMPLTTLRYLRSRLPAALLSNLYGPTEITVDAIFRIFEDELDGLENVPLGRACENKSIILIDAAGRPVDQPDTVAEICVAGIGVALGYWNDPQRTAEVFIQNPQHDHFPEKIYRTGDLGYRSSRDGLIYMTGRRDEQIKHMGYRIEPGEIECALSGLQQVTQCCVLYDNDNKEIVAFYTSSEDDTTLTDPRTQLAEQLPRYMMPRRFICLPHMPVTQNGKVDRSALWENYRKQC